MTRTDPRKLGCANGIAVCSFRQPCRHPVACSARWPRSMQTLVVQLCVSWPLRGDPKNPGTNLASRNRGSGPSVRLKDQFRRRHRRFRPLQHITQFSSPPWFAIGRKFLYLSLVHRCLRESPASTPHRPPGTRSRRTWLPIPRRKSSIRTSPFFPGTPSYQHGSQSLELIFSINLNRWRRLMLCGYRFLGQESRTALAPHRVKDDRYHSAWATALYSDHRYRDIPRTCQRRCR